MVAVRSQPPLAPMAARSSGRTARGSNRGSWANRAWTASAKRAVNRSTSARGKARKARNSARAASQRNNRPSLDASFSARPATQPSGQSALAE